VVSSLREVSRRGVGIRTTRRARWFVSKDLPARTSVAENGSRSKSRIPFGSSSETWEVKRSARRVFRTNRVLSCHDIQVSGEVADFKPISTSARWNYSLRRILVYEFCNFMQTQWNRLLHEPAPAVSSALDHSASPFDCGFSTESFLRQGC
jgi:hypothetical protein